jgi:hypothetical protein
MECEFLVYCKHHPETTENAAKIARAKLAGQGNNFNPYRQVTRNLWPISAACRHLAAKTEVLT